MARPYNWELKYLLNAAFESADEFGEKLNSLQLLFAIFMFNNSARMLFEEQNISEERLISFSGHCRPEPDRRVEEILDLASSISAKYGDVDVNCLHLVVAACRTPDCMAYHVMKSADVPISNIRTKAVSLLANLPDRYQKLFAQNSRMQISHQSQISGPKRPAAVRGPLAPSPAALSSTTHNTATSNNSGQNEFNFIPGLTGETGSVLESIANDMLALAHGGAYEAVSGFERESVELVDILNKRRANNPIIVGPPGVGKTALIEGLAWRIAHQPESLPGFGERRLMQLETSRILQGTHLRGSLAKRMETLRSELRASGEKVVFFVDEIHQLINASSDAYAELAQEFKTALSFGDFSCIGASTWDDYNAAIDKDPAFSRYFHILELKEPDEAATLAIVRQSAPSYSRYHGVEFDEDALLQAVRLSTRYINERCQPDKALSLLDMAASRAHREGRTTVDVRLLAELVAQIAEIPTEQLVISESDRYLKLEEKLARRIIGHEIALKRLSDVLRRNAAGFRGERPIGSFLFAGPTGVGKTEVAKALAMELFGSSDHMVRFDMSEFSESHSLARLIGAPPGYVGYSEGGQLTEALRRKPFQIVLLDEIEKAHHDVIQVLLQILDDGRLTDGRGRRIDFSNAVIIMTSNLGSRLFENPEKRRSGFGFASESCSDYSDTVAGVIEEIRAAFPPELFNRIDEKLVFEPLSRPQVAQVAMLLLESTARKLLSERRINLIFDESLCAWLADNGGYEARYGARPMRRAVQTLVEGPLAAGILSGEFSDGDTLVVRPVSSGGLEFVRQ